VKSNAKTQTAICIAGAHRSGKSMLARLLRACGLYLGPKDALMPPQADNPDGFWEREDTPSVLRTLQLKWRPGKLDG